MKKIRVYACPTHCTKTTTPGVDYVRMILPMTELQKDPRFEVTIYDNNQEKEMGWEEWDKIARENDILFINYLTLPFEFAKIGMLFRKYNKKIVFDIDDLIWEIQDDNSSYHVYAPGSDGRAVITDIVNEVDYVTVTNNFLKNALISYTKKTHDKVFVMPNRIDLDLYNWRSKPQKNHMVRIGYFGSSSHFNDLGDRNFVDGLTQIMEEYPNVEVLTIGAMLASFKKKYGMRYINDFGHQDLYTWVKMMPEKLGAVDIFAVPLAETTYCKSKSSIKYLEMSSTKKPGVYQKIRQYSEIIEHGKNGYLAHYAEEWYKSLKELIDSPHKRKIVGKEAFRTVEENWQMKDNVKDYVEMFQKIMRD